MFGRQPDHYIEKLTAAELEVVCDNLRTHGAFDGFMNRACFEVMAREYHSESAVALVTRSTVAIPGWFWKNLKVKLSDETAESLLLEVQ